MSKFTITTLVILLVISISSLFIFDMDEVDSMIFQNTVNTVTIDTPIVKQRSPLVLGDPTINKMMVMEAECNELLIQNIKEKNTLNQRKNAYIESERAKIDNEIALLNAEKVRKRSIELKIKAITDMEYQILKAKLDTIEEFKKLYNPTINKMEESTLNQRKNAYIESERAKIDNEIALLNAETVRKRAIELKIKAITDMEYQILKAKLDTIEEFKKSHNIK